MRTLSSDRNLQILDTAAQLFAKRHYHEVRMDDIAVQAGVSKGTLYRYFEDKEDLYLALTVHGMKRLLEESQHRIDDAAEPEEKLLSFITGIIRFYQKYPYFLELIARIEISRAAASAAALQTIRGQFFRVVTSLVAAIHATGRYSTSHPELSALALQGIIRHILRMQPQPWPDDLPRWIYNQFLHGMSAPKTEGTTAGHQGTQRGQ